MRTIALFSAAACLSCAALTVNGQGKGGKGPVISTSLDSGEAQMIRIEPIPGLSLNAPRKESSVVVNGTAMEFEVYYGGSACDSIRYSFEAHADSLYVIENSGTCYLHGQRYGVKGVIGSLKSGGYHFAVVRRFQEKHTLTVFQREIVIP